MTTSAPSAFTHATLAVLVVVATKAPRCLASWMATVPTPPEPAWMKTFCPGFSCAVSTSVCHAVSATSGSEAASTMLRLRGLGATEPALTAMNSANVPMRSSSGRAYTSSPGLNWETPAPTRSTVPARSLPRISGRRYGRTALNSPRRIFVSSALTLAACTRMSTSPSRSGGVGTSPMRPVSFLPYRSMRKAFMRGSAPLPAPGGDPRAGPGAMPPAYPSVRPHAAAEWSPVRGDQSRPGRHRPVRQRPSLRVAC
ncbi:hypothetical protein D3C75_484260 [compost metagenome]